MMLGHPGIEGRCDQKLVVLSLRLVRNDLGAQPVGTKKAGGTKKAAPRKAASTVKKAQPTKAGQKAQPPTDPAPARKTTKKTS